MLFLCQRKTRNRENPHKYSIYQQNNKRKIRKFTTKLQQTKEPYVTTYAKKYTVMEE